MSKNLTTVQALAYSTLYKVLKSAPPGMVHSDVQKLLGMCHNPDFQIKILLETFLKPSGVLL